MDEYLGNTDDPAELRDRFLDLLGDIGIVMPSIKALNYHRGELMNTSRCSNLLQHAGSNDVDTNPVMRRQPFLRFLLRT